MQTYDPNDILMSTDQGELEELMERARELQESGAVRHAIGLFPSIGQAVEINGLQFKVVRVSPKKGCVRLEIEQP